MKRRDFLKVTCAGSVLMGLSGCVSNNSENGDNGNGGGGKNEDGNKTNGDKDANKTNMDFPDCGSTISGKERVGLNAFTVDNSLEKPRSIEVSVYEFGNLSDHDFQNQEIKKLIESSSVSCVYGKEFDLSPKESEKINEKLFKAENKYLIRATSDDSSTTRKISPDQNCVFKKLAVFVEVGSDGEIKITRAHGDYPPEEDPCNKKDSSDSDKREYCVLRDRLELVDEEDEVKYGSSGSFELKAQPESVNIGDKIKFELRNTSDKDRNTGTKDRYTIQKKRDGGWKDIHWVGKHVGWDAEAVIHKPDHGFDWELEVSQHGISRGYHPYMVCSSILPGEYRFVYMTKDDKAVAAKFEVQGCDGNKSYESAGDSVIEVEWTKSSQPGDRYVPISFSELSSDEKSILKTVIEQGSFQTCEFGSGFQQFFERARETVKEQGENADVIYLKYGGTYYGLKVRKQDMVIASR